MKYASNELINKIKTFVKRYYWNELLKGSLLFLSIILVAFIAIALLEYFSFLNSTTRLSLLIFFIALTSITTIIYIIVPVIKLLGLGKQLSMQEIALIIGTHFPEIDDKLLNLFQLQKMEQRGAVSTEILEAAIERKSATLTPFPFLKAIPIKKSIKYAKWAAIPCFIFLLIAVVKSEMITEPTKRVVNYGTYYEKPAPYKILVTNEILQTYQNDDFTVTVKVEGDEVPQELFIQYENVTYKCQKKSNAHFEYTFTNLQRNTHFQFSTEELLSAPFLLKVLPKPLTISYVLELNYPAYTQKINETIDNNGDATVPEGTKLTWKVYTKNTESLQFLHNDTLLRLNADGDNFVHTLRAHKTFNYALVNENKHLVSKDTLTHIIHIIKDQYPEITVQQQIDSVFADRIYFKGNIKDDYGFKSLAFVYTHYNANNEKIANNQYITIEIKKNTNIQDFFYYFDAGTLGLNPGDRVEFHFAVADNDGVNGAKTSRSTEDVFVLKTQEQIEKELQIANQNSKSAMEDLIDESAKLIKDIEKLHQQLMQQTEPNWQDKKNLEALLKQFNELQNKIEQVKEDQELNQFKEEKFNDTSAEILKKQQELQKRMNDILTDEMKEMMQKMQEMMQEMNKEDMQDAMENMKLSSEDINKSLDQQLQLFKQLEFEKKFEETLEKAHNLANEQRELQEKTQQKGAQKETLKQQQDALNQKFTELKKEMQSLQQMNQQLEEPIKMSSFNQEKQQIADKMQQASESLQRNNKNKAAENQGEAADEMEDLAKKMEQEKNEEENEDIAEDIESLRQILDNLIKISIKQEAIMARSKKTTTKSPNLNDVIRDQFNIQDYMRLIDDSLSALARRQPTVQPFIQKEVTKCRNYLKNTQDNLAKRSIYQSVSNQQFALTSMNNLALMLAESLKEMNQKKKESDGKCNKQGGKGASSGKKSGKSKPSSAKELQQQLNRQMEALQRSMEEGKKQGQSKPGGMPQMSEQFARMAAQQEAIRKMMQEYNNELKSESGMGDKSIEQMMKEMEQTERELVNRVINRQTINRQKNIETRLLQSERAQMEREKEEKREATEARKKYEPTPPEEWNIDKQSQQQMEMLKTIPPSLQYYYREKINQYFYRIEK